MPTYRAFFVSENHINRPAHVFEAANDTAAMEHARGVMIDGHGVEVWLAARRIGSVGPTSLAERDATAQQKNLTNCERLPEIGGMYSKPACLRTGAQHENGDGIGE